jgi:NAD dependent epimerase/dehydratase family enzyme
MNENLAGQRIVVTGASGLIGRRLVSELQQAGAQVIRAVRRPVEDQAREMFWDPDNGKIDATRLEGVDAVVHLAGENIAGHRWTESFKQKIRDSRVNGTRLVSEAIAGLAAKSQAFVCASAIGYYGDRGDETLSESSPQRAMRACAW